MEYKFVLYKYLCTYVHARNGFGLLLLGITSYKTTESSVSYNNAQQYTIHTKLS